VETVGEREVVVEDMDGSAAWAPTGEGERRMKGPVVLVGVWQIHSLKKDREGKSGMEKKGNRRPWTHPSQKKGTPRAG